MAKSEEERDDREVILEQLKPFLENHPYSEIEAGEEGLLVVKPWNDDSVCFRLRRETRDQLIAALNDLVLPPRFNAIYHADQARMEYIFTILSPQTEYLSRSFDFTLDSNTYRCSFAPSSDRLLCLASSTAPTGKASSSDYRNLFPFFLHMWAQQAGEDARELGTLVSGTPTSFFVEGFPGFDEELAVRVSKHLNFFMRHYDRGSPYIMLHEPPSAEAPAIQLQFMQKDFPRNISATRRDAFMLDLALAAAVASTRLAFLYYFQMLEYAAFYHVNKDVKRAISRIIRNPGLLSDVDGHIDGIIEAMTQTYRPEHEKVRGVVEARCCVDAVWSEIEHNREYFKADQAFDGGFTMDRLINDTTTRDTFDKNWCQEMAQRLCRIRNCLAHAREQREKHCITPTPANDRKLRPWLSVIRRMAEQVLIYDD